MRCHLHVLYSVYRTHIKSSYKTHTGIPSKISLEKTSVMQERKKNTITGVRI